jgi:branched-chain amino acid transport system substrate-binding protein
MKAQLVAGVVAMLFLFAPWLGEAPAQQKDVIKIGMTNSFSGPLARSSTKTWQGVMVWEAWVNAKGGIFVKDLNRKLPVKIVYYDDETKRENLIRLYERLATTDQVDFFFAPWGSGQTFVVAALSEKYKKLMIAHTGSSPSIYEHGNKYLIQGLIQSQVFGRPYVEMLEKVDPTHKRLAMVWEDHLFPKSTADLTKAYAEKQGYEIVLFEKFPFGATDITPVLTKVKDAKPDHIYILANIEGTILAVRQAAELKLNARSIGILDNGMAYYKDALGAKVLEDVVGPVEWDTSVSYPVNYGPDNKEFIEWHKKTFPRDDFDNHTPLGLTTGLFLQKAIEEAGTLDSAKVRQVFCSMKVITLVGPHQWECATGKMNEPQYGGPPTIVTQWRADGSTVTVWPPPYGDVTKFRFPKKPF